MISFLTATFIGLNIIFSTIPKNIQDFGMVISNEQVKSYDNLELLALICMAEAEGESEEGKRLVIDTILNRVDSDIFPNTVYDVIYQKNQFSCINNGRVNNCYVSDDILTLVDEEIKNRTNRQCLYFNAGGYPIYATPLFKVGNHYFSGEKENVLNAK